jgi:quercetin dioxygenase-like cupin family protein
MSAEQKPFEEHMADTIRRVVTGHDRSGKAIVISDGPCTSIRTHPNRPGHKSTDIWKTIGMPVPIASEEPDPTQGPRDFVPVMGTKIRISEIPPEPEAFKSLTPEQAREFFKEGGNSQASTFGQNQRHPFMHRTESVDYAVVLEGEITMLLDEEDIVLKAGDIVIQRGTNHAWSNRSGKPVRMLYILIDGKFEPELKQYSQGRHK